MSPSFESVATSRDFFPRNASAGALIAHLQATIPYLFEDDFVSAEDEERRPYLTELAAAAASPERELEPAEYFRLCLAAHWASVGSFVPADVEHLVGSKLWHHALPSDAIREMAETVLEAYHWDSTPVTGRWIVSPHSRLVLSGHHGEWLAVAIAAYAATASRDPLLSQRLRETIEFEVTREAKIYLEFRKARDGVGLIRAAGLVAHNLGDLDRAIDLWNLSMRDPLSEFAYRVISAEGARAVRFGGALAEAGRLNRSLLAGENHRHFALRMPRALRRSATFLLPMAPFFDEWGRRVGSHAGIRPEEVAAIVDALYTGWEKLKGPTGTVVTHAYPRAVAGILEAFPGGLAALAPLLPARVERNLRSGLFHGLVSVGAARFHEQWAQKALGSVRDVAVSS
ncbi:MAG: hypothetical protein JST04_08050 [Bdellovibrionales bacterium]|nr:hypothetical protein [Bdellovibrionales bacterium]